MMYAWLLAMIVTLETSLCLMPAQGDMMLLRPQVRRLLTIKGQLIHQPPARVRLVFLAPKNVEPFTGECPLCMVEYVSGQPTCTTCGYEPLPIDETGEVKFKANRRTKVLEKRMKKLAEFGRPHRRAG
jgi:hypothetical protein